MSVRATRSENFWLFLDFGEFVTSLSVTTRGSIEEKLKWAFQIYDIDGNGYITQSELFSILKSVEKMAGVLNDNSFSKSRVVSIFNLMDKNHDDRLSLEEFLTGAKEDESLVRLLTSCKWCKREELFFFSGTICYSHSVHPH